MGVAEDAVRSEFWSPQRVSLRAVENPCAERTSNVVSIRFRTVLEC